MTDNIETRIRDFIISNFLFDDAVSMIPDDASLLAKGIIDSTGVLDVILFLEEEFGITVADEDVLPENLDSVVSLSRYTRSKHTPTYAAAS